MKTAMGPAHSIEGVVEVPGDKSITHRAFLLAAIARGTTNVRGANTGDDCARTLSAVRALGARVERKSDGSITIEGRPGELETPPGPLDLGNSGTGLRLLAGVLAGRGTKAVLTGDASLRTRPMTRVVDPLLAMGCRIRATEGRAPLTLEGGAVHAIDYASPVASAQVKSAVLLAALGADGSSSVREPAPSRDHTERMLAAFGIRVTRRDPATVALEGPAVPVAPAAPLEVPRDPSAAAFWLVATSIVGEGEVLLPGVGLNPGRTGILDVLRRMGAAISVENTRDAGGEPVGDLRIRPAPLTATDIAPGEVPGLVDELPVLAIAQARARGRSQIRGAGELRVKESDRIRLVVEGLRGLGVKADELEDGWRIEGGPARGGTVRTDGDHRIAMAFLVLGLAAESPVEVEDSEMIDTSYPGFYHALRDRVSAR